MFNTMKTYLDLIPLMDTYFVARHPGSTKALHLRDPEQASASSSGNTQDALERGAPPAADLYEHNNRRGPVVDVTTACDADAANQ